MSVVGREAHLNVDRREELPKRRPDTHAVHREPPQPGAILLGSEETAGRVALIETVEEPDSGVPCHRHHWQDKLLYVVEGALNVYVAGQWIHAPAGAAVWLPRGIEHSYVAAAEHTRVLAMFTPAGFEGFYRELDAPPPWADEIERLVATAARYGCEITGPHPEPPTAHLQEPAST